MIAILDANDLDVILQAVLRKLRYIVDNYQLKWQRSQVKVCSLRLYPYIAA